MKDTMAGIGIGNHDTVRCYERLRDGAQRFRQPPQDIPGQWTCLACGQERVWLVKTRCFRCGCPKGHDKHVPDPFIVGPAGRPPERFPPTNPSFRPYPRQNHQPATPVGTMQNFPPSATPLPVGPVDVSCSVPPFRPGRLDRLKDFLQTVMSPEGYEKCKTSFGPAPLKEEIPLAVQLAIKTEEPGSLGAG